MTGSSVILQFRTYYRANGANDAPTLIQNRLNRIALTHIPRALDQTLEGADLNQKVVVCRSLLSATRLRLFRPVTDLTIAERWACDIASALASLMEVPVAENAADCRVFESRAAYVAAFAEDLVAGRAQECWWYGAFKRYTAMASPQHALEALLIAECRELLPILAHLRSRGSFELVIGSLEPHTRKALTGSVGVLFADALATHIDVLRPLFEASLALTQSEFSDREKSSLLLVFAADTTALPLWSSPDSLSACVRSALAWLEARGVQKKTGEAWEAALATMDWLDGDLLSRPDRNGEGSDSPVSENTSLESGGRHQVPDSNLARLCKFLNGWLRSKMYSKDDVDKVVLEALAELAETEPAIACNPLAVDFTRAAFGSMDWLDGGFLLKSDCGNEDSKSFLPVQSISEAEKRRVDEGGNLAHLRRFLKTWPTSRSSSSDDVDQAVVEALSELTETDQALALNPLAVDFIRAYFDNLVGPAIDQRAQIGVNVSLLSFGDEEASRPSVAQLRNHRDRLFSALAVPTNAERPPSIDTDTEPFRLQPDVPSRLMSGVGGPTDLPSPGLAVSNEWEEQRLRSAKIQDLKRLSPAASPIRATIHPAFCDEFEFASPCAGIVLVLRALADVGIAGILHNVFECRARPPIPLGFWVASFLMKCAGPQAITEDGESLDPSIPVLAGVAGSLTRRDMRQAFDSLSVDSVEAFSACLNSALEKQSFGTPRHVRSKSNLSAVHTPSIGLNHWDACLGDVVCRLLEHWARWLTGFSGSSTDYLLHQFIRRPGVVSIGCEVIRVDLPPRPLDMVLQMAGYLDSLRAPVWLPDRRIEICRLGS